MSRKSLSNNDVGNTKETPKSGRPSKRLHIEEKWEDAIKKAVKKPKPKSLPKGKKKRSGG